MRQDTARNSLAGYLTSNPDGYTLRDGSRITSPGKFEGERLWVAYFAECVGSEGSHDIVDHADGTCSDVFLLEPGEAQAIGEPEAYCVILHYSDQGFISGETATQLELEAYQDREADAVEESEEGEEVDL